MNGGASPPGDLNRTVETPSGKGRKDENFPVASRLIAPHLRPHIIAFYDFVRAADDIADNPDLAPDDKLDRLNQLDESLTLDGPIATARRLAESLAETGLSPHHARAMLSAFRQDATKTRYASLAELWDYCDRSACPVGRTLVDLHGESQACYRGADALSAVLQVLNHLQDMTSDLTLLDRVYVPLDRLKAAGGSVDDLKAPQETPALRQVIHELLDACEGRMRESAALLTLIKDPRFAAEASVVDALARRLLARLRRQDPVASRVKLSKIDFALAAAKGARRYGARLWG
ncbi:MAG: squalene/phytoene synthase family protein [Pseudomonadota bacterium]